MNSNTALEFSAVQIIQSHQPSVEVQHIIIRVFSDLGRREDYIEQRMGSAWFVEVPSFLNDLYKSLGEEPVVDVLQKLLDKDALYDSHLWDIIDGKPYQP